MNYDLTIPVWGVIVFVTPFLLGIIWTLVKMFFWQKGADGRFVEVENRLHHSDIRHDKIEKDFNENIIKVRTEFEKEIERVNSNISKMLEKQIETQTLVKILVEDRKKQ